MIYTSEYLKNIIYDVNTLVGAKYIIMNDSFIKKQKKFSKEINTMLIAFGGYDPHNVTLKIIESLATIQSELIDKKINIGCHCSIMFTKGTYKNLINTVSAATFGTSAKNNVTAVGEPSYTSGAHIWNGTADILKANPTKIKTIPKVNP